MTKTSKPDASPLRAAVEALDEELERFEHLAATAQRLPLTSERNLEKAARAVNEAAECQGRVAAHVQALIAAIQLAQKKHDATAEELVKTRDLVQARGERYHAVLARFAVLGQEAADISQRVRQLGELKGSSSQEVVAELTQVQDRMAKVVEDVSTLAREAEAEHLEDLGRQCDSLKQQMQSALNKVTLLREKLAATLM